MGSPVVAVSPRKSPTSGRRTNKPLVEKKRRARINGCLTQLKSLILSAMQTEGAQVSRLEKADILEMTVKYLRHMQRQQVGATAASEPEVVAKFSAGYSECASEVIRYIDSAQCVTPDIRSRLESHLVERLRGSVSTTDTSPVSSPGSTNSTPVQGTAQAHHAVGQVHNSQNVSSTAPIEDSSNQYFPAYEMTRHYQTAVDLANMASAVTAKETTSPKSSIPDQRHVMVKKVTPPSNCQNFTGIKSSTNENSVIYNNSLIRSQSTSPPSHRLGEYSVMPSPVLDDDARRCYSSSEPSMSHSPSSLSPLPHPSYMTSVQDNTRTTPEQPHNIPSSSHNVVNRYPTDRYLTPVNDLNNNNNNNRNLNEYLRTFQRPLHIDIPGSPVPAPTPSPPFLHPHLAYTNPYPQSHTLNSSPSPSSLSSTPTHTPEDAPPTILYGYNAESETGFHTGSVNCLHNNENSNPVFRCNNTLYPKTDTNYSYAPFPLQEPHGQNTLTQTQRGSAIETTKYARAVAQNTTSPRYHHQHQKMPATPSPPTLIREEPYSTQINHAGNPEPNRNTTNSYHHTVNNENQNPSACHKMITNSLSTQTNNNTCADYTTVYQGTNRTKFLHPHRNDHYDLGHPHSNDINNQSSAIGMREPPAGQTAHTKPFHNGQAMNGAKSGPRVLSRQDAAPLSPPALKKRLLFGQGSEGEKRAPRFNEIQPVKTRSLHEDVEQSEVRRYQEESWRKADTSSQKRFFRIPSVSEPAVMVCTAPAHSVSIDDGLWRPW